MVVSAEIEMSDHEREIYRSENGDRWLLCRDDDGRAFVLHKANTCTARSASPSVTPPSATAEHPLPGCGLAPSRRSLSPPSLPPRYGQKHPARVAYHVYRGTADRTLRLASMPGAGLPAHVKRKDWVLMPKGKSPVHSDADRDVGIHGYCFFQVVEG